MSRYRAECLKKTTLPFTQHSPNVDETPLTNELPPAMVTRLARAKADKVQEFLVGNTLAQSPSHILASDQALVVANQVLGKPHTLAKAREQLQLMSGKTLYFYTSLCLLNRHTEHYYEDTEITQVKFRNLQEPEIEHYLALEKPFDCAGSFKSEASGAILCEAIHGRDPNALVGLPLMLLTDFLIADGYSIFSCV